jgi:hypothetical protein
MHVRFGSVLITLAAPSFSVGQTMRQKPSANRSQHLMGIANGGGFRARDWVITRLTAEHSPDGECPVFLDGLRTVPPPGLLLRQPRSGEGVRSQLPGEHVAPQSQLAVARGSDRRARSSSVLAGVRPGFFRQAPRPLVCCIITGQPSSARAVQVVAQGVSELTSIFITTSVVLLSLHGRHGGLELQRSSSMRPAGCSARLGSIRSARGASPTSSLAARTAGSTRRPHRALRGRGRPWLTRSTAFARCRPRVETAGARCNTRVARLGERASPPQWGHAAGLRRPLGRARLMAMSPSRRSSAHGCWKFRVTSKHLHCLGWGISVSTPLMA